MADAVIVPPTPVVRQGEPVDNSLGLESVQKAFDTVLPAIKTRPTPPKSDVVPPPPAQPVQEPQKPVEQQPAAPAEKAPEKTAADIETHKLPSFLEEALKVSPEKPVEQVSDPSEDWPTDLPQEERKRRNDSLREAYKKLKSENESLRSRTSSTDEMTSTRLQQMESDNKAMRETLTRMGLEQHQEFQNNIVRPMTFAWNEASRVVHDAGGDPNSLAKAMSLSGKAQFEALDEVFSGLPESAKSEASRHITEYRRFNEARAQWLKNAPQKFEELRRKDVEREYQTINQQRQEMKNLFDEAGRRLREEAKVELAIKSPRAEDKWWNDMVDTYEKTSESLYLENTDLGKMAMACRLAPLADGYRKLWLAERQEHGKTKSMMKDKFESEPSLSEGGGRSDLSAQAQLQEDLKQPFANVFLRELHKQQAR